MDVGVNQIPSSVIPACSLGGCAHGRGIPTDHPVFVPRIGHRNRLGHHGDLVVPLGTEAIARAQVAVVLPSPNIKINCFALPTLMGS